MGDGVGCGRIDSDGNDLSAAVGEDTGGVADTGAINAKDKKNFINKMLSSTTFFPYCFLYYILNSIYIHWNNLVQLFAYL